MGWENLTSVSEFFLLGLAEQAEQQELLFGLFLSMYLITVAGNLLIILAVITDARLHTKALLLAVMAYDRYVAICHPLHYTMVMSPGLYVPLVSASWIMSGLYSLLHTLLTNSLSFCAEQEIPHFFCDINPLLRLSCTDPFIIELVIFSIGGLTVLVCVLSLIISYAYIFSTIRKIPSTEGKQKALSTCSSHLSVVSLFFGSSSCVYFSPPSTRSAPNGAIVSVMYTAVTPMLNPFIYSLRNRDIKSSLRKLIWVRKIYSPRW